MFSTVMIGIAGGSGSGKSTFTKRIKECFPEDVAVLYHDNYYKSNDGVPFASGKRLTTTIRMLLKRIC